VWRPLIFFSVSLPLTSLHARTHTHTHTHAHTHTHRVAFVLTASYASRQLTGKNALSILTQGCLYCMIFRIRNTNPGYISRNTLAALQGTEGSGNGSGSGYIDKDWAKDINDEEEAPVHEKDEYMYSMWLYYQCLVDRSLALVQQSNGIHSLPGMDMHSNTNSSVGKSNSSDSGSSSSGSSTRNVLQRSGGSGMATSSSSRSIGSASTVYQKQEQEQEQEEEEEDEDFSGSGTSTGDIDGSDSNSNRNRNNRKHSSVRWQTGIHSSLNVRHFCCHICRCTRLDLIAHKQQQRQLMTSSLPPSTSTSPAAARPNSLPPSLVVGHSHQTHRCVSHFDHYCVFLGTDIAGKNYVQFLACSVLLVMIVFPLFFMATTEHVRSMSHARNTYLHSLHVIQLHLEPIHLDEPAGGAAGADLGTGGTISTSISSSSKSGTDMLQDYQKPLFLQGFLVWSLLIWMQMFALMCFHLYCKFWKGVSSRNVLQTLKLTGAKLVHKVQGIATETYIEIETGDGARIQEI